jgi:hypothetical protein
MNETTDTDTTTRRTGAATRTSKTRKSGRAGKSAEERAAEVEALAEQLNDAVTELTRSPAWVAMLRVAARFTRYSAQRAAVVDAGRAARV